MTYRENLAQSTRAFSHVASSSVSLHDEVGIFSASFLELNIRFEQVAVVLDCGSINFKMDHDDSVIFLSFEGRPGIEISLDQISPGAVARAFSVSSKHYSQLYGIVCHNYCYKRRLISLGATCIDEGVWSELTLNQVGPWPSINIHLSWMRTFAIFSTRATQRQCLIASNLRLKNLFSRIAQRDGWGWGAHTSAGPLLSTKLGTTGY